MRRFWFRRINVPFSGTITICTLGISSASTHYFPAPVALHLQTVSFAESDACKRCRRRNKLLLCHLYFSPLAIPVGSQESWKYDAPRFRVRLRFTETRRSASGAAPCGPERKQTIYKTIYDTLPCGCAKAASAAT